MKLNLPKLPEGLKINISGKKEPEKLKKPTYVAPNLREYYLHPQGSVRRVDLRGTTRREWRAEKRRMKRERIKKVKYFTKPDLLVRSSA